MNRPSVKGGNWGSGKAGRHAGNRHIHRKKKIDFGYADPGGTFEKIRQPKNPYLTTMKSFTFQKGSKKMLFHQRANNADQKQ